jgi:hypothetical protein
MAAKSPKPEFYKLSTLGAVDEDTCVVSSLIKGVKGCSWRVGMAEPLAGLVPDPAVIEMDPDARGSLTGDLLGNTSGALLVSDRFKQAVEKCCKQVKIEYWPFRLIDPRGRVHRSDLWLVNPLGTFDCLNHKASGLRIEEDEGPNEDAEIRKHVLDPAKCRKAPALFRVAYQPSSYVVDLELARAIYDEKFSNVLWSELPFAGRT